MVDIKKRQGVTLIEALFVLGIMAILIGAVMVLLSQNTTRLKNNQMLQEIGVLQDAFRSVCSNDFNSCSQGDFDFSKYIVQSKILSDKYLDTTNQNILDPYGSPLTLTFNGNGFLLIYDAHNPSECYAVMNYVEMSQSSGVQVMGGVSSFDKIKNSICPGAKGGSSNEVQLDY